MEVSQNMTLLSVRDDSGAVWTDRVAAVDILLYARWEADSRSRQ